MPQLGKTYQERLLRSSDEWKNHPHVRCWEWRWVHSADSSGQRGQNTWPTSIFEMLLIESLESRSWSVIFLSMRREIFLKPTFQHFMLVLCSSHSHFQNPQDSLWLVLEADFCPPNIYLLKFWLLKPQNLTVFWWHFHFRLLASWENKFLLLKPPHLWHLVMAV